MKTWAAALLALALCLSALTGCGTDTPAVADIRYTVPDGFAETSEEGLALYQAPDGSGSNITVMQTASGGAIADVDEAGMAAQLEAALESQLKEALGQDVDVIMEECTQTTVDELPAIRTVTSYRLADVPIRQMICTVDAGRTYTFTYTQMGEADWWDEFEASAASIDFIFAGE